MKHDLFEFHGLTRGELAWRIALLVFFIAVLAYDLLIGRPG